MNRAIIVASGPSAAGFVPPADCMVIAVNGAIEWLPRATHFFTLDHSAANQHRLRQRRDGVKYCAGIDSGQVVPEYVDTYLRRRGVRPEPADKHSPEWWLWRWSGSLGLRAPVGWVNTGNSAWGALQIAYKYGARRVALVGVDASDEPRVEGGTPNNLSHLPLLFESALGHWDFEFVNCGAMQSRVPQMTIEEGMRWLLR